MVNLQIKIKKVSLCANNMCTGDIFLDTGEVHNILSFMVGKHK